MNASGLARTVSGLVRTGQGAGGPGRGTAGSRPCGGWSYGGCPRAVCFPGALTADIAPAGGGILALLDAGGAGAARLSPALCPVSLGRSR